VYKAQCLVYTIPMIERTLTLTEENTMTKMRKIDTAEIVITKCLISKPNAKFSWRNFREQFPEACEDNKLTDTVIWRALKNLAEDENLPISKGKLGRIDVYFFAKADSTEAEPAVEGTTESEPIVDEDDIPFIITERGEIFENYDRDDNEDIDSTLETYGF
jgi:hypothetical protein